MNSFLKVFIACFLAGFVMVTPASAWDANGFKLKTRPQGGSVEHEFQTLPPVEKDGWKLDTLVLQPGSRSQGYHGVLTREGTEIQGQKGEEMETPLGLLKYHGSMDERPHLWSHSGWVMITPESGGENNMLPMKK
ncbi:MAG: hypothetical protein EOM37_15300 [Proteobacteria bacterium]|nr:hypothetical protein [Pseudomonadota bacterium]